MQFGEVLPTAQIILPKQSLAYRFSGGLLTQQGDRKIGSERDRHQSRLDLGSAGRIGQRWSDKKGKDWYNRLVLKE